MAAELSIPYNELASPPTERQDVAAVPEIPTSIVFEGVKIQWDKGQWEFNHPELGTVIKDTYSIWNPHHWHEIATRLNEGQISAAYIMGNYGGVLKGESPEWQEDSPDQMDEMFDQIKQRSRTQNMVVFADPEDIIDFIDVDRLEEPFKNLRWADQRDTTYAGPQHNIFPLRGTNLINQGFVRNADQTVACFWIPEHWGYEGLANEARTVLKHGLIGGSSLNVHGQEPCYTSEELYTAISQNPAWMEEIDFIIFDELAESTQIGRSQTMVRFTGPEAEIIRQGSLSQERIAEQTGVNVKLAKEFKQAAYKSGVGEYSPENNAAIDQKVTDTMSLISRYTNWYKENFEPEKSSKIASIREALKQLTVGKVSTKKALS